MAPRFWEVASIKGLKVINGQRFFLVNWAGKKYQPSWQPEDNLLCDQLIENFINTQVALT
jgi:hypothetical protein